MAVFSLLLHFLQNDDFKPCVCVCEKMISNIIFQLVVLEQAFCLFDNGTIPVKIDAGLLVLFSNITNIKKKKSFDV